MRRTRKSVDGEQPSPTNRVEVKKVKLKSATRRQSKTMSQPQATQYTEMGLTNMWRTDPDKVRGIAADLGIEDPEKKMNRPRVIKKILKKQKENGRRRLQ